MVQDLFQVDLQCISNVPAITPTHYLFLQLRIMPFEDRLDFRILTMVIKALNKCAPPYIAMMLIVAFR